MAVATPVLERQTYSKQAEMSADELHNAKIKENYKRLINPELNIREVKGDTVAPENTEQSYNAQSFDARRASILNAQAASASRTAAQPVQNAGYARQAQIVRPAEAQPAQAEPYLVRNARADADIFRADSIINQRRVASAPVQAVAVAPVEEDEDEDLRPTRTTIQYKTAAESDRYAAKAVSEKETHVIGKREKIIIATFISVVAALFILVIVNSAVIAGLSNEVAVMQSGVEAARVMLDNVNSQINSATSLENIANYALSHGMYLL